MVQRYRVLREIEPGAAERFLSGHFQLKAGFTIALVDPDTGTSLNGSEMLDAITSNLLQRTSNEFSFDRETEKQMLSRLSDIRSFGACPGEGRAS